MYVKLYYMEFLQTSLRSLEKLRKKTQKKTRKRLQRFIEKILIDTNGGSNYIFQTANSHPEVALPFPLSTMNFSPDMVSDFSVKRFLFLSLRITSLAYFNDISAIYGCVMCSEGFSYLSVSIRSFVRKIL